MTQTLTFKLEREINPSEVSDLIDTALQWEWWNHVTLSDKEQTVTIQHDLPKGEGTETTTLTYQQVVDAAVLCFKDALLSDFARPSEELGMLDAVDADIVLQYAVYGELVFG